MAGFVYIKFGTRFIHVEDLISQKYGKMVTNKTRTEKKLGLSIAIYSPDTGTYFSTHDWEALQ